MVSVSSYNQNQLEACCCIKMVMDFDALMMKKLGGGKQPVDVPLPEPVRPMQPAMEVDKNPVNLLDDRGIIPPLPRTNRRPKKTLKGPLATMRPRVKCSKCDFTSKEGTEMRGHVENKHQTWVSARENAWLHWLHFSTVF